MNRGLLSAGLLLLFISGCAKANLSDRDLKRNQAALFADMKRRELIEISGGYVGTIRESGRTRRVSLYLEIKDMPTPSDGNVDPVLTPVLAGYLRFPIGSDSEYGFSIQRADFNPKTGKVDLVATHSKYRDLIFSGERTNLGISGSWATPSIGAVGTAEFTKKAVPVDQASMAGEYGGVFMRDGKSFYFGHVTFRNVFLPPDDVRVSATFRLILGDWKSSEFFTYQFDAVEYNPVTGQMVFKADNSEVILTGKWSDGEFTGDWASTYTGKLGTFRLKKDEAPTDVPSASRAKTILGTYQGPIENYPGSNLPERVMLSIVTAQDLKQPNGIRISGTLRLYLGAFNSIEYVELPFVDIQINIFNHQFLAKTEGDLRLTLRGSMVEDGIKATISADALGEIARTEVRKI